MNIPGRLQNPPHASLCPAPLAAFSLIELLTVIAVVGVLSGLSIMAFNGIRGGSGVGGAVSLASSIALQARTEALSETSGSRLVIDVDPESEYQYRRFTVLRKEVDPSASSPGWKIAARPSILPEGIFFLPNESLTDASNGEIRIDFKAGGYQDGASGTRCRYIEFSGTGQLLETAKKAVVFGNGPLQENGEVLPANKKGRRGFVLQRGGRPVFFESATQIDSFQQ